MLRSAFHWLLRRGEMSEIFIPVKIIINYVKIFSSIKKGGCHGYVVGGIIVKLAPVPPPQMSIIYNGWICGWNIDLLLIKMIKYVVRCIKIELHACIKQQWFTCVARAAGQQSSSSSYRSPFVSTIDSSPKVKLNNLDRPLVSGRSIDCKPCLLPVSGWHMGKNSKR